MEVVKREVIKINKHRMFHNIDGTYYKGVGAFVIKDRNPIGKFKKSPKHKGIVTILMDRVINRNYEDISYSHYALEFLMRQVFIFNLEDKKQYEFKILARIGKHNINITHYISEEFIYTKKILKKNIIVNDYILLTKEILLSVNNFRIF